MSEKAEAFGQAMGEAAEAISQVTGWSIGDSGLALVAIFEEFARSAGFADMQECVRARPIEQTLEDVAAFRDALLKKALPTPPKRKWWAPRRDGR